MCQYLGSIVFPLEYIYFLTRAAVFGSKQLPIEAYEEMKGKLHMKE
jgi:hypothetical protein